MPSSQPASFPDFSASVGDRIKALRTRRGISLSALAATTNLGKGTLSELERGRRNPTLDTLFAITTALAVPLSDLLVTEAPDPAHARDEIIDAELLARWTEPTETVEVYRMTIHQGRRRSTSHSPGVTETITVLTGEITVGVDESPAHLTTGQSHTFPGDQDHIYEGLITHSSTVLLMRYPQ